MHGGGQGGSFNLGDDEDLKGNTLNDRLPLPRFQSQGVVGFLRSKQRLMSSLKGLQIKGGFGCLQAKVLAREDQHHQVPIKVSFLQSQNDIWCLRVLLGLNIHSFIHSYALLVSLCHICVTVVASSNIIVEGRKGGTGRGPVVSVWLLF